MSNTSPIQEPVKNIVGNPGLVHLADPETFKVYSYCGRRAPLQVNKGAIPNNLAICVVCKQMARDRGIFV